MADADRCVCCGEIVPEGRQVCPLRSHCGHKIYNIDNKLEGFNNVTC